MNLKKIWNQFLDKYTKSPAEKIDTTTFPLDETKRYRMIFSGHVQGVGFRYETWMLAQKLELVGFVKNMPDETVAAELQGPVNKILFLIDCLQSIPRIQIENIKMDELELKQEHQFEITN